MSAEVSAADAVLPPSRSTNTTGILVTLCILVTVTIASNVGVLFLVAKDQLVYIVAINGSFVPIITILLGWLVKQTHDTVNSRMDRYEELVKGLARAQGNREGRAEAGREERAGPVAG